jgi:hypothetical protein
MDADEREICDFLKSYKSQFVSAREICKRAGGKWRSREDPHWAIPILQRLVDQKLVESDPTGHYRLIPEDKDHKKKLWVSPQNKKLLDQSGKSFDDITEVPGGRDLDADL